MPVDTATLFNRANLVIELTDAAATYQASTLPADANAVLASFETVLENVDTYRDLSSFQSACLGFQSNGSLYSAAKALIGSEIVRQVRAFDTSFTGNVNSAIDILYDDMVAEGDSIDNNACTVTATNPSTACHQLLVSVTGPLGTAGELVYDETIVGEWTGTGIRLRGERAFTATSAFWPTGSGLNKTLTFGTNAVTNGDFSEQNELSLQPESWQIVTGTTTNVVMTVVNTQTIVISGTPTTDWYRLTVTDPDGNVQVTEPISYDADGGDVQTALAALTGFEDTEVTTTGTSPNYTHTVTFYGVAGAVPIMSSYNEFDTGSIAHAITTSGDTSGYADYSMYWLGDGSSNPNIKQQLTLVAGTVYAGGVWLQKSISLTGTLVISLRDGAGTVINDNAGTANSSSLDVSTLTSGWQLHRFFFRTPDDLPDMVFLDIRTTSALANTRKLYFDQVTIVPATAVGGFYAAVIAGDPPTSTQEYSIAATNDYSGKFQTMMMRYFNRQLPSSGSPTIADPSASPSSSPSSSPSATASGSPSSSPSASPSSSPSTSASSTPSASTSSSPSTSVSSSPSTSVSASPSTSPSTSFSSSPSTSASSTPSASASSSPSAT